MLTKADMDYIDAEVRDKLDAVRVEARRRELEALKEISTLRSRLAAAESALASEREARERAEDERDAAMRCWIGWEEEAIGEELGQSGEFGAALELWSEITGSVALRHCQSAARILAAAREKGKEGRSDG